MYRQKIILIFCLEFILTCNFFSLASFPSILLDHLFRSFLLRFFFLSSWEHRGCAREISTHTHTRIDESPSTLGFLFNGGPHTESWVQCLFDESFPSTSPRNHHHRFFRSLLSPPHVSTSYPLPSSYLCPIPIPFRIVPSRTDYFLKDDTYAPKRFKFPVGKSIKIISK